MIHLQLPEMVLLLLAPSTLSSLEPKLLLFQSRVNGESLQLLKTLPISPVLQCLAHRKNFQLPQQAVSRHQYQKGHALAVLHEILQQIFSLYWTRVSPGAWEENRIERVLAALHQQLQYVESLTGPQAERQSRSLVSVQSLRLQIKAYFRRIRDYLEHQRSNSCAWIIVQVEVNRCMFSVLRHAGWMSKQELDP